ncbi:Type I Iterative PKS, partial [Elasticomyces elasticus]
TGQCKTWDKDADGYCRAEGVGSVVIKRYEDAVADNDNILATVLSSATNHSAEAISITHPHAGAQEANYRNVMHKAGINPLDVSYVEIHGTGTQAGDATESESVLDVFAPVTHGRRKDQPLTIGAVKSNIGHGEAAAGITSIIKTLLCFQKGSIPKHIGIKTEINPKIPKDLVKRNVALATADSVWPRPASGGRLALVNSFGAHGGNTTMLLEDAPERTRSKAPERSTYAVVISAKSKKSLRANMEGLTALLRENPATDLADLSYTTCARRIHHGHRVGTTESSTAGLLKHLNNALEKKSYSEVRAIPSTTPTIVFTFTGQGTLFRGSPELFEQSPVFRQEVLQLDQLVTRLGFESIIPIVEGTASEEQITSPVSSQLSIVVLELALVRYWASLSVKPDTVVGHSLGEYVALAVAGVLSAVDVLYLVGRRAQMTVERCTPRSHAMLSVRGSVADIRSVLRDTPECKDLKTHVSCQNTERDTVLGGLIDDLDIIRRVLEAKSFKATMLDMPYAFHTAQMDVVVDDLEKIASRMTFKTPNIPVLSASLGEAVFDGKTFGAKYLRNHTRGGVNFVGAIEAAQDMDIADEKSVWVDIGAQPTCTAFVRSILPKATVAVSCKRNEDNITTITKSLLAMHLAGLSVSWTELFRPNEDSYKLLELPAYGWNETNFWIPYYGTWTLDKAMYKHGKSPVAAIAAPVAVQSTLKTSLVHKVTQEDVAASTVTIVAESDMQHPDFLDAVNGHRMNNCGVATSSIWTDMALTVGEHAYRLAQPKVKEVHMNLCDVEVLHAQVASTAKGVAQPLQIEAKLDVATASMSIAWFNINAASGERATDHFASGTVRFEDPKHWQIEWNRVSHLVLGRIEALERMAATGAASKLSKNLAYTLFKNVVDYADKYRGIDSVILNDHEAVADVTLTKERHGTWHTPPHWIDSVAHLAGLIMNGSDASNTKDYFYVTPGCDSFRLLKPLEAGGRYRSYVRMFLLPGYEANNMYGGDVYILQNDEIVASVMQIRFRRVPRMLMDRFFTTEKSTSGHGAATKATSTAPAPAAVARPIAAAKIESHETTTNVKTEVKTIPKSSVLKDALAALQSGPQRLPTPPRSDSGSSAFEVVSMTVTPESEEVAVVIATPAEGQFGQSDIASQCLSLIARETSLSVSDLSEDAQFANLGVDSLMSLVLAEKLKAELGLDVKSSLFLECPTVGEMVGWMEHNS